MRMIARVPRTSARGRFREGSFTSPLMKERSAHPSYAHITETIAVASAETPSPPVHRGVKLLAEPVGAAEANSTRRISAPYLVAVATLVTAAAVWTPW